MVSNAEMIELYRWVDAGMKSPKTANFIKDFQDGVALVECLMFYHPTVFTAMKYTHASGPMQRQMNWEQIAEKELKVIGVKVDPALLGCSNPLRGQSVIGAYALGKPELLDLVWQCKVASDNFNAESYLAKKSRAKSSGIRKSSLRPSTGKKLLNYLDALDGKDDGAFLGISFKKDPKPITPRKSISIAAKPRQVSISSRPPTQAKVSSYATSFDPGSLPATPAKATKQVYSDEIGNLKERLRSLEQTIASQQTEIDQLKKFVNFTKDQGSSEPRESKAAMKPAQKAVAKSDKDPLTLIAVSFLENQKQGEKGKAWINCTLLSGEQWNIFFNEKTGDVKCSKGAHRMLDETVTLKFSVDGKTLTWPRLSKWVESAECGFENAEDKSALLFVPVCLHYITKLTDREQQAEKAASRNVLDVIDPSKNDIKTFDEFRDEVEDKIEYLKKADKLHNTSIAEGVKISKWELFKCAYWKVPHGTILFGKVHIGNSQYVHVRAHKFDNGRNNPPAFHSIDTGRNNCTWDKNYPLVYFDY